jgi:hypothetical protein
LHPRQARRQAKTFPPQLSPRGARPKIKSGFALNFEAVIYRQTPEALSQTIAPGFAIVHGKNLPPKQLHKTARRREGLNTWRI